MHDYSLFCPVDERTATNFKRRVDKRDPGCDEPYANDDEGSTFFKFTNIRRYGIDKQQGHEDFPYQEVALVLYDPDDDPADGPKRQKGAYYLPVHSKQQLKPRPVMGQSDEPDLLEVEVRDMEDEEMDLKRRWQKQVDIRDE